MAYDEQLADRIRMSINGQHGWAERRMFGGVSFTLNGHMCCGVNDDQLMLRMGEERATAALSEEHTREMDFTGMPLKGMLYVDPQGFSSAASLARWIRRASEFVATLPHKTAKPPKKRAIARRSAQV